MITRLKEVNAIALDQVDKPMLLGDSARPGVRQVLPQPLRLADACKWLAQHGLDQLQNAHCHRPIVRHPMAEVATELRVEDGLPGPGRTSLGLMPFGQGRTPAARTRPSLPAGLVGGRERALPRAAEGS